MAALSNDAIAGILLPFYPKPPDELLNRLSTYLDLLLKWNARTNLTSIRTPEEIVRRHFGESLFLARHLPAAESLLDFGSGAGFPGLPVQMVHPGIRVTLAESQHKKVAFLREAVRALELPAEVWPARVDLLPAGKVFDVVALRAVDNMEAAMEEAVARVADGGWLVALTTTGAAEVAGEQRFRVPGSERGVLSLRRVSAPVFHVEHRS